MNYDPDLTMEYQDAVLEELAGTGALPEDAKSRYEIFKKYIGKFYFFTELLGYLTYALREDDIHSITAAIQELDEIRQHESLTNPISRGKLYKEAKEYAVNMVRHPLDQPKSYDSERLTLMIYLLHENNYFDTLRLPDEAFIIDGHPNNIEVVGEVYGQYFTFYDYLQSKLQELESASPGKHTPHANKPETSNDEEDSIPTFRDLFLAIHKPKFDQMIQLLLKELPMQIINRYPELDRLDGPILYEVEDGYALNSMLPSPISYLAGIFIVSKKSMWLKSGSIEKSKDALAETFKVDIGSTTAFKSAKYGRLDAKYIEPFRLLFKDIK
jgi:hypothetical protein